MQFSISVCGCLDLILGRQVTVTRTIYTHTEESFSSDIKTLNFRDPTMAGWVATSENASFDLQLTNSYYSAILSIMGEGERTLPVLNTTVGLHAMGSCKIL